MTQRELTHIDHIAQECAQFAEDNSGDADFAVAHFGHATSWLGVEDMWRSWHHDKEGIGKPPLMPDRFVWLYLEHVHEIGGDSLLAEVVTGKVRTAESA